MKKLIAGLSVVAGATLVSLAGAGSAQAYPDTSPSNAEVKSTIVTASQAAPAASGLPGTGGPDASLLAGGGALLLVGGASVVVARRRNAS